MNFSTSVDVEVVMLGVEVLTIDFSKSISDDFSDATAVSGLMMVVGVASTEASNAFLSTFPFAVIGSSCRKPHLDGTA